MGLLDTIAKRLGPVSDEQLAAELDDLRDRLRLLRRANQRPREAAHAAADQTVAAAQAALDEQLDKLAVSVFSGITPAPQSGGADLLAHLGALFAASRPELAQAWHAAIDRAPAGAYSALSPAEFAKQERALVDGIRDRELELERRRIAERQAEADQALAQLEAGATR